MLTQIRPAQQSDVAALFQVRTAVEENLLTIEQLSQMGITETSISEMIAASPCAWVAVVDNQIVGFSMIDIDEASLFAAFVLPSHEGKGIGKPLVLAAEDQLFRHHDEIWLETGKNTRAVGFYRHIGWGNECEIDSRNIRLTKQRR